MHDFQDVGARRPCCRKTVEKAVIASVKELLGQADPIPAESRWAHLLDDMR